MLSSPISRPIAVTPTPPVIPYNYPSDISGLAAWWSPRRSDGYTAAGGFVSQLNDLSGNGHTLTQATGAKQPAIGGSNKIGVSDALFFDGVDDIMTGTPFMDALSAKTIFIVAQAPTFGVGIGDGDTLLCEGKTTDNNPVFKPFSAKGYGTTDFKLLTQGRSTSGVLETAVQGSKAVFDGQTNIMCYRDTGTEIILRVDGEFDGAATAYTKNSKLLTVLALGAFKRTTESNWFNGYVGDVIVYDRVLSISECKRVEAMLDGWYRATNNEFVHLLVMAGQSNCEGRGTKGQIPATNAAMDTYYGTNPTNLYIYQKLVEATGNATGDVAPAYFVEDGKFFRLDSAYSTSARTTTQQSSAAANVTNFGAELQYAYEYSLANPGVKVVVIKCGLTNSSMAQWDFANATSGSNWKFFRDYMLRPAIADMGRLGLIPSSVKVFWMQGEYEAVNGGATQAGYQALLDTMRSKLIAELGIWGTPIKFAIGGLAALYDGTAQGLAIKAAQVAWCAIPANTAVLVPTDGTGGRPALELNGDGVHYSTAGHCDPTEGLGKRVFDA